MPFKIRVYSVFDVIRTEANGNTVSLPSLFLNEHLLSPRNFSFIFHVNMTLFRNRVFADVIKLK